ncbi:polymer-forming cytoskeletal protein [Paenibacillus protaetiae]|uniref:Polymer-forming cytoskeletal protein n=1 Tax=Paenibacillus protaetiae TaxID=2509456 RepID=A0A4P6F6A3_9BACL|nr:polymer-forming cytoskeletal protein [Paenibacillus protaetiae]QAY65938.1 hypothetical protein ET464_05605 [Paenibacillus protaetiae]
MKSDEKLHNMKLVGQTTSYGGRFRHINILGEAEIMGDTECDSLKCTGTASFDGNLAAQQAKVTGEYRVRGSMHSRVMKVTGSVITDHHLKAESVHLTGMLSVKGSCEAGNIQLKGGLEVDGLLSADRLDFRLLGASRAGEIGGGAITVKRSKLARLKSMFQSSGPAVLTAETIEGDELHLDHITAGAVRGNRVHIGAGCRIERLEYRQYAVIHRLAVVKEQVRL